MPPAPPEGSFDVRFETAEGGSMVQTHAMTSSEEMEFPVTIQSDAYPVTISWKVSTASYRLADGKGGEVFRSQEMVGEGSYTISSDAVTRLVIQLAGEGRVPKEFALSQNYPNPFNPTTTIKYGLPVESRVTVEIYNMIGQKVRTLVNGNQTAGYHTHEWNALNDEGRLLASGVYLLQVSAKGVNGASFQKPMKLLLLK